MYAFSKNLENAFLVSLICAFLVACNSGGGGEDDEDSTPSTFDAISAVVSLDGLPTPLKENAIFIISPDELSDDLENTGSINISHRDGIPTIITNEKEEILAISVFSENGILKFDAESTAIGLAVLFAPANENYFTRRELVNAISSSPSFANLVNEVQNVIDTGSPVFSNQSILNALVKVLDESLVNFLVTMPTANLGQKAIPPFGPTGDEVWPFMIPYAIFGDENSKKLKVKAVEGSEIVIENEMPVHWTVNGESLEAVDPLVLSNEQVRISHNNRSTVVKTEFDLQANYLYFIEQVIEAVLGWTFLPFGDSCQPRVSELALKYFHSNYSQLKSLNENIGDFLLSVDILDFLGSCTKITNARVYLKPLIKAILFLDLIYDSYSVLNTRDYNERFMGVSKEIGICISEQGLFVNCAHRFELDPWLFVTIAGSTAPIPRIIAYDDSTSAGIETPLPGGLEYDIYPLGRVDSGDRLLISSLVTGNTELTILDPITGVELKTKFDIIEPKFNKDSIDVELGSEDILIRDLFTSGFTISDPDRSKLDIVSPNNDTILRGSGDILDITVEPSDGSILTISKVLGAMSYKANKEGAAVITMKNTQTGNQTQAIVVVKAKNLLLNSGFETPEQTTGWVIVDAFDRVIENQATPLQTGRWIGDRSEIVVSEDNIEPIGSHMLKFINTTYAGGHIGVSGQVYQLIDVTDPSNGITPGVSVVTASFKANRIVESQGDLQFRVEIYPFSGDYTQRGHYDLWIDGDANTPADAGVHGKVSAACIDSDSQLKTWQEVSVDHLVPEEATYLIIGVSAIESESDNDTNPEDPEFAGHYADDARLSVINNWSGAPPAYTTCGPIGYLAN